jgi:hypothetical protein
MQARGKSLLRGAKCPARETNSARPPLTVAVYQADRLVQATRGRQTTIPAELALHGPEQRPRRGPVGACDLDREADQEIVARIDGAQVESLDHPDA